MTCCGNQAANAAKLPGGRPRRAGGAEGKRESGGKRGSAEAEGKRPRSRKPGANPGNSGCLRASGRCGGAKPRCRGCRMAGQTTSMWHRCCRSDINVASMLLAGGRGTRIDACGRGWRGVCGRRGTWDRQPSRAAPPGHRCTACRAIHAAASIRRHPRGGFHTEDRITISFRGLRLDGNRAGRLRARRAGR